MEIKTVDATSSDKASARALFNTLFNLRGLYWPSGSRCLAVLDAFARNGQLTVSQCLGADTMVDAWELSAEHYDALVGLGCHDVSIGCSYKHLGLVIEGSYDMVVIDTPQGIHSSGDGQRMVEHFTFLKGVPKLMKNGGVVVLYLNCNPYNAGALGGHGYDSYSEYDFDAWVLARELYYGKSGTLTPEDMISVYRHEMSNLGMTLSLPLLVPCLSDVPGLAPYAFRLAFRVDHQ